MRILAGIAMAAAAAAQESSAGNSVELGFRWNPRIHGSRDAYRSVVNLGEGPRILSFDWNAAAPWTFADTASLSGSGWGGDPWAFTRGSLEKRGVYRLRADYRSLAYFNALPSFANPAAGRGVFLNQRSFDTNRRYADVQFDWKPGGRISPYFGYSHDSGSGRGVTNYTSLANEYPVLNLMDDRTRDTRGGVTFSGGRGQLTLEQGWTWFRDEQRLSTADRNLGNRTGSYLGRELFLQDLEQRYDTRGDGAYSRAVFNLDAGARLAVSGQFLYSRPDSRTHYNERAAGLLAADPVMFVGIQNRVLLASAIHPHITGSGAAEVRITGKLRVLESFTADRLNSAIRENRFEANWNRQQAEIVYDPMNALTLRGGHRFTWGDMAARENGIPSELQNHAALAGVTWRRGTKWSFSSDLERTLSDASYFRASLHDYTRARLRLRWLPAGPLSVTAVGSLLDNDTPGREGYRLRDRQAGLSAYWTPRDGKRFTLLADYTRSRIHSSIGFLVPQDRTLEISRYQERAHAGTLFLEFKAAGMRLGLGGSAFVSEGSRPMRFYRPQIQAGGPFLKRVEWLAEWRWHQLGEPFYRYEEFRAHQALIGLRFR